LTVIFSILIYPAFFLLIYAVGEYFIKTRNGAMAFSMICSAILCLLYYTIRKQISQYEQAKKEKIINEGNMIKRIALLDESHYKSFFKQADSLCDNSPCGLNEEKLISHLRAEGTAKEINIFSLNGITEGSKDLLDALSVKYVIHPQSEILLLFKNANLPEIKLNEKAKGKEKLKAMLSKAGLKKQLIKYGVTILLFSIITPYKIYYIVFGSAMLLLSLILTVLKKINRQNQIQGPQS